MNQHPSVPAFGLTLAMPKERVQYALEAEIGKGFDLIKQRVTSLEAIEELKISSVFLPKDLNPASSIDFRYIAHYSTNLLLQALSAQHLAQPPASTSLLPARFFPGR